MGNYKKLKGLEELVRLLRRYKNTVVTTGAFDVPHEGHWRYLKKARRLGSILVLILHSDELIALRKGDDRPIYKWAKRVRRMTRSKNYTCVDYIYIAQTQQEVYEAITALKPKILVTSLTTTDLENCSDTMSHMFGNTMKVVVMEAQSDKHSTEIIRRRDLKKEFA